ncbi:MAG: 7-cyano-7-deazaguanine synthase [Candidatus Wallbacteria bacterium]|nr:7-cyano-7-deazaguanine synthase [Candidatus Wallbacteria bacterium]
MTLTGIEKKDCVLLYSGGTDSTCTAALMAEHFQNIHLLTFYQGREKKSCISENIQALENKFGPRFIHKIISTTKLVKFISYHRYLKYLFRHRWLVLSTCGFTTLSWHINAIVYCRLHQIEVVADGLTRELMHFPGHMDAVMEIFRKLYAEFGISYQNPVRGFDTPPDRQFIDRLIVDQHGFFFPSEESTAADQRTTGQYLYQHEILPHPDVKGSPMDHRMQYDCYPFILYNVMIFWIYLNFQSYETVSDKMSLLFKEKVDDMRILLKEYFEKTGESRLSGLLDGFQGQ